MCNFKAETKRRRFTVFFSLFFSEHKSFGFRLRSQKVPIINPHNLNLKLRLDQIIIGEPVVVGVLIRARHLNLRIELSSQATTMAINCLLAELTAQGSLKKVCPDLKGEKYNRK